MNTKKIFWAFIGLCLLINFTSCQNKTSKASKDGNFDAKEIIAELDFLLNQLDDLDATNCQNLDEIVTINEKMRGVIESIRSVHQFDKVVNAFDQNRQQIAFVVSKDKRFGVFSWETKMDCLGNGIKNVALYKWNEKIMASSLYGMPLIYDQISTKEPQNKKKVYFLYGTPSKAEQSELFITKAYTIIDGDLTESNISLPEKDLMQMQYAASARKS
ncbi:hypothetical protein [Flagellimonas crocea]|uniref:hypothetical protein n=1 Tax=Flagellimonas crocea TaxID=3067311 RepID=UPI00296FC26A|nr:hypothetical protein [Muricauda sp. DH64]